MIGLAPLETTGQVFLASEPHPQFAIGPLIVAAVVLPEPGPIAVNILWGITLPPNPVGPDFKSDLYLLWPAEVVAEGGPGQADSGLARYAEERGFTVLSSGRVPLRSRDRAKLGTAAESDFTGVFASFVTLFKRGTNPSQSGIATYVKIPWVPHLPDPRAMNHLTLAVKDTVAPKPATWFEEFFWGRRHILTLSAGSAGSLALYSLYYDQRDRIVRLGRDFSVLLASFADAEHLRIEEITPASATRRSSRVRAGAETVSLPLSASEGLVPQVLKVQFSYFRGRIAWRPVLVSLLLLVLGNIAGLFMFGQQFTQIVRRHVHLGRNHGRSRLSGTILPPETVARLVPGDSVHADVIRLCGPPTEERTHRSQHEGRVLVYRGTRAVPRRRLSLGWVGTISHWDVEEHEMEIALDGERVVDIQSRLRRFRA
jgi:hypothetical protein